MKRSVFAALAAVATLAAALGGTANAVAASAQELPASHNGRYIVRFAHASSTAGATAELRAAGVKVLAALPAVGMTVVTGSSSAVARAAALPDVVAVTPDAEVHTQALGFAPSTQAGAMTNITRLTGAQAFWKAGYTGNGVDVAVLDTGVAPVASLKDAAKVVVGPDLSFESQAANLRYLDTYGHGTAMASVAAGREIPKSTGAAYAADTTDFVGMAPDARVISIKVGDHNGAVDVSQLIAGIDWVAENRTANGMNIKVLNLSFGLNSKNAYGSDPLAYAAENVWKKGVFVVSSAGNDGLRNLGMASPAYDPYIFAVGANDTKGTDALTDDSVADFSAHPNSLFINRAPDIVAPGVKIVSAGVPGSAIWNAYPSARLGNGLIRGSGTSQAAAVVSGAAALILQKYPTASPDTVKDLLTRTATKLSGTAASLQGNGELNLTAALAAKSADVGFLGIGSMANLSLFGTSMFGSARWSNGAGSLESARGDAHVAIDGVPLTGERDIMGMPWSGFITSMTTSMGLIWNGGSFNGAAWIGDLINQVVNIVNQTWSGRTWSGRTWSGNAWSGRTWSGRTWSNATWNGSTWSSATWNSSVLMASSWAGITWASSAWN